MKVTFSRNSGCCGEEGVEGGEAAQHVLGEVGAVDPDDQVLAAALQHLALRRGDLGRLGRPPQPLGVDRERVGAGPGLAAGVAHQAAVVVDVDLEQFVAAAQEVDAVGVGVEADDVVGEHAAEDRLADPTRQDPPAVGLRPGDVDEVVQEGVGPLGADHPRGGVEVVVVEHHQRPLATLDLAEDGLGDVAVDGLVAVVPGVQLLLADVGSVGEVPEVVLDEPEDRVGDHVVEAVVGLGVAADQQHPVVDPVDRELDWPAALLGDRDVLVGHRRGDPERLAVRDEAGKRRDQAAAAAPHGALAGLVALELRRPAVGDDDQRIGVGHRPPAYPDRSRLCIQLAEQLQPVAQQARREELAAGMFLARPPQPLAQLGVGEDLEAALARTRRASRPGSRSCRSRSAAGCRRRCRPRSAAPSRAPR